MDDRKGPDAPSERVTHLISRLDEVVSATDCPICGENSWDYGAETLVISQVAPNPKGRAIETFPTICTYCGYVRLHSTHHLENPRLS